MSENITERPIRPVILSGGAGKRLWPLSRPGRPKQLIALTGAETLLQQTARRVGDTGRFGAPILVAGSADAQSIEAQLAAIGIDPVLLILEPCGRNTAAAIALAAAGCDADEILLVLPSDHCIEDEAAFRSALQAALPFAIEDWLVTFGVEPDRPETGYGYIQRGAPLGRGVFQTQAFVEKPDRETAERWLAEGGRDWNAGIFLFKASTILRALEEHAPDIIGAARDALAAAVRDGIRLLPDRDAFERAPSLPIDTAVMEKSRRVAVAPVDMGWSDVGSWDSVHALGAPDENGNVTAGSILAMDSKGCLIHSDGPTIITVGAQDLIVVATPEGVLVAARGMSQKVKDALDALAARGRKES